MYKTMIIIVKHFATIECKLVSGGNEARGYVNTVKMLSRYWNDKLFIQVKHFMLATIMFGMQLIIIIIIIITIIGDQPFMW
jgi:hypothetical protein